MQKLSYDLLHNLVYIKDHSDNNQHLAEIKQTLLPVIDEQLTERQRQVLTLYFYDRKNIYEIADLLKVNKSTVSRTLARAKGKIKNCLKYYKFR